MKRLPFIACAFRAILCLALILPGAAAGASFASADGGGWMVICGANGIYLAPAPEGFPTERPSQPSHADCALCTGCTGGCAPLLAVCEQSDPSPVRVETLSPARGGALNLTNRWAAAHPRGPPIGLLS